MHTLSVGECIGYGWETFKRRPWILIGGFVLTMLISQIPDMIAPYPPELEPGESMPPPTPFQAVMLFVSIVVSFFVSLALTNFSLRAHDNIDGLTIGDLWNPTPFWRFLGADLLLSIIVVIGLAALVVPGVIAMLALGLAPYFTIDRASGPIEALKASAHITNGHKWQLLLLFLAIVGINMLGALALLVGLVVSVPVSMIAMAHAYRVLSEQAG